MIVFLELGYQVSTWYVSIFLFNKFIKLSNYKFFKYDIFFLIVMCEISYIIIRLVSSNEWWNYIYGNETNIQ